MADNITIMNGAGTVLASDEIDGVQVLRVKVQAGDDGTAADVSESNPLPVDVRSPGLMVFRSTGLGNSARGASGAGTRLFGWHLSNSGTVGVFVKLYDAGDTMPQVGGSDADTPVATLFVPPGNAISSGHSNGIAFTYGICVAATTGAGDGDTGAPAEGTVVVNLFYA